MHRNVTRARHRNSHPRELVRPTFQRSSGRLPYGPPAAVGAWSSKHCCTWRFSPNWVLLQLGWLLPPPTSREVPPRAPSLRWAFVSDDRDDVHLRAGSPGSWAAMLERHLQTAFAGWQVCQAHTRLHRGRFAHHYIRTRMWAVRTIQLRVLGNLRVLGGE